MDTQNWWRSESELLGSKEETGHLVIQSECPHLQTDVLKHNHQCESIYKWGVGGWLSHEVGTL